MAKSYMEEVAKMFNVELDEVVYISQMSYNPYRFTKEGLVDKDGHIQPSVLWYLLTGGYEIKKEILTPKEKAYLEAVLKPFRDRDIHIERIKSGIDECLYVYIDDENMQFPFFERGSMYKGMKACETYNLKELGLFE